MAPPSPTYPHRGHIIVTKYNRLGPHSNLATWLEDTGFELNPDSLYDMSAASSPTSKPSGRSGKRVAAEPRKLDMGSAEGAKKAKPAVINDEPSQDELIAAAEQEGKHALVLAKPASTAVTTLANENKQLVLNPGAEENYLEDHLHKPSMSLRIWFGRERGRRMNIFDFPYNEIHLKETKYTGSEIDEFRKKYPTWKKTRDVQLNSLSRINMNKEDKTVGCQIVGPYMKAIFVRMNEEGNMFEKKLKFDPHGEFHKARRSLTLTDAAVIAEMDDEGKNPLAARFFDIIEQLDENIFVQAWQMPTVCEEIKKAVSEKDLPAAMKLKKKSFDEKEEVERAARGRWRSIITNYKGTRQLKLSESVFRFRSKEKDEKGNLLEANYRAPTEKLQEIVELMGSRDYNFYSDGKFADRAINEIPVYVPKTAEENKADFDAGITFPWRQLPYTESCRIADGDMIAPWIKIEFNEGDSNNGAGLSITVIGLFWLTGTGVAAAPPLKEPFYL